MITVEYFYGYDTFTHLESCSTQGRGIALISRGQVIASYKTAVSANELFQNPLIKEKVIWDNLFHLLKYSIESKFNLKPRVIAYNIE